MRSAKLDVKTETIDVRMSPRIVQLNDTPVNSTNRVTDFIIRTYRGDGHWLIYLLRSIEKFVSRKAFRNIIITYDISDAHFFQTILPKFSQLPIKTVITRQSEGWKYGANNGGYHAQMYSKMQAYKYSDAEYFVHVDSDCLFNTFVDSSHFFDREGRVYVKSIPYSSLTENYRVWKGAAEGMLKITVENETMTRFPFTFPRNLYPAVLSHISNAHGGEDVLSVMQRLPVVIEFTTLGAYLTKFMPNMWVPLPPDKEYILYQAWSWGGFGPVNVAYYECVLQTGKRENCSFASEFPTPSPSK